MNVRKIARAVVLLTVLSSPALGAVVPALGYRQGVVATDHPLASAAGIEILKGGGNAVDAACAAAFALGVVNPAGSGLGGGGFMLVLKPGGPAPQVLDFREVAPAAATREMFMKPGVAKDASRLGGLAVAVPGEVLGCAEAIRRYGALPLARVLAPALRLARQGFRVGRHLAATVQDVAADLRKNTELARLFLPAGKPLEAGQLLRRPALARTLATLAREGPQAFYHGWIARDLVQTVQQSGGLLTLEDLASYQVKERQALRATYRGTTLFTMPPPSSGGIALVETLNILEHFTLPKLGHNSSEHVHRLTEALKHAFADRARHLGDPDFVQVPVENLTSKAYAARLAKQVADSVRAPSGYGSPEPPKAASPERGGTSHISVVDKQGTAVALTTTINTLFGSMLVGRASGVILNNEMDDFAAEPGRPNAFGLVQGEQNAVAARKRPLSSMSPTIVLRDGHLLLVVGASGGPTIITGTLQALSNIVDFSLEPAAAVSAARIHHQWLPGQLIVEADLPRDVLKALELRGHRIKVTPHPFTAVQLVLVKDGWYYGVSDPRKFGEPAGY